MVVHGVDLDFGQNSIVRAIQNLNSFEEMEEVATSYIKIKLQTIGLAENIADRYARRLFWECYNIASDNDHGAAYASSIAFDMLDIILSLEELV